MRNFVLGIVMMFSGCASLGATVKSDAKKAIDCLHDVEPTVVADAKGRIEQLLVSGITADKALSQIEALAIDESPEVVGCAAFAVSLASPDAGAAAAQYVINHNMTFTATGGK